MKIIQVTFHSDPGHGWYEVPRKLLDELGLLHKITPFSYQKGKMVYLEEDQDAYTFFKRVEDLGGEVVIRTNTHTHRDYDSPIRKYARFSREY